MKQYRLKQWYPRIPVYLEDGYVISFNADKGIAIYEFVNGTLDTFEMSAAELECTQYWELIKEEKPLFVTEDRVECFDKDEYYSIGVGFKAIRMRALEYGTPYSSDVKRFKYKSNADEYIWRNKPLFSYEDIIDNLYDLEDEVKFEQLAKERSK